MFEIFICPIKKLYTLVQDGDFTDVAAITVSSYEIRKDKLQCIDRLLCFNFNDITDENNPTAFNQKTADKIAEFIKNLPCDTDTLFVCCDSGESRSAAMAAAIMRYNNADEMQIWKNPKYHPNPLVYRLLCRSFGIDVPDINVNRLTQINEKAFRDSMSK